VAEVSEVVEVVEVVEEGEVEEVGMMTLAAHAQTQCSQRLYHKTFATVFRYEIKID
jgi:hypothetical protein